MNPARREPMPTEEIIEIDQDGNVVRKPPADRAEILAFVRRCKSDGSTDPALDYIDTLLRSNAALKSARDQALATLAGSCAKVNELLGENAKLSQYDVAALLDENTRLRGTPVGTGPEGEPDAISLGELVDLRADLAKLRKALEETRQEVKDALVYHSLHATNVSVNRMIERLGVIAALAPQEAAPQRAAGA